MEDGFLIKQVLNGNRDAFQFLVLRYQRPLFRYLSSYSLQQTVLEEIAQETFLRAYQNLKDYDSSLASFSTWLLTIGKNLTLNALSKHSRKKETGDEEAAYLQAEDPNPLAEEQFDANLTEIRVKHALDAIPMPFRSALTLSYFQDLSIEEVASIEGCSVGTVKSRVFRAKNLLRLALGKGGKT